MEIEHGQWHDIRRKEKGDSMVLKLKLGLLNVFVLDDPRSKFTTLCK